MKILMLGWEYPPHISGGLATACHGLVQGLLKEGHKIKFVMPKALEELRTANFQLISASNIMLPKHLNSSQFGILKRLVPHIDQRQFEQIKIDKYKFSGAYGPSLMEEVYWFAVVVSKLAQELEFDIIHAHDWLTYLAGIVAKEVSGKPLVVHVHATEFDRSAHTDLQVFEIEKQGMLAANRVMAVSKLTRKTILEKYNIVPHKVVTTYNGVIAQDAAIVSYPRIFKEKIVTFLGRITYQKGPAYFIEAAEKVLDKNKNVRFVMAGNGDLMPEMIKKVAAKNMSSHFHFAGFLRGPEVDRMLSISDVFVMPSVSEPFGIAPLEAIRSGVPVIISKQSGVAEVLPHALHIDYWDTDSLAEAIQGLLRHKVLSKTVHTLSTKSMRNLTWERAAANVSSNYLAVA